MTDPERMVWAAAFAKWSAHEKYGGFLGFKSEEVALRAARAARCAVIAFRVALATNPMNAEDSEAIAMVAAFSKCDPL